MKWHRTTLKNGKVQGSILKLGSQLREISVHHHIDDPEQLFVSCHPLNFKAGLGTLDFDVAEKEAHSKVTRKLEAMLREVEKV